MSDRTTPRKPSEPPSRRTFLKRSAAGLVGGTLAAALGSARMAHAAGDDTIRVGLVGCGGRGNGAAVNAANADPGMRLVALADIFEDQLEHGRAVLSQQLGEKFAVDRDHLFSGFDAYKKLIDSDVDVVLLATPPHFRPAHLAAAVDAGKHVFCEKPVAVDPTGVNSVLATCDRAAEKKLSLVSGLCWRYDEGVRQTMAQIKEGALGDIVAVQENYLTGTLWHRGRNPAWSEMEYQIRNWLYFTWLSGDHIVEQHVHSLDKALWLMDDKPPLRCVGLGGRQVRTGEEWGNIFDHFSVCYEWAGGVKVFAYTRQMSGCAGDVDDYVLGTKGRAQVLKYRIDGEKPWRFRGESPSMYDAEHRELFASIRNGTPINNGRYMSYATMMAIIGREACYTGQTITWEEAMRSMQDLTPPKYEWGDTPVPEVAVPGVTKFA